VWRRLGFSVAGATLVFVLAAALMDWHGQRRNMKGKH